MKIKSEVKVGLIGITTLVVLIWGINYLKGRNILTKTYTLHAFFENSGGLEASAPVTLNGMKIGFIDAIELQSRVTLPIHVIIQIEKAYSLESGTRAVLYSADLMGSKAIRMETSGEETFLEHNDTLLSASESDMFSSVSERLMPVMDQIGALAESIDAVVSKLDRLLGSDAADQTLQSLSEVSVSLSSSLSPGGSLHESFQNLESFTSMLESQEEEISTMTGHLNSISEAVDSAGIEDLVKELESASGEFAQLMEQINSGNGTVGKLVYSDSLYNQLQFLVADLDSLVVDLNENPQNYVRFSLFGK